MVLPLVKYILYCWLLCCLCIKTSAQDVKPFIQVLGTAQDGGYPHMGCKRTCCEQAWKYDSLKRYVVSLALVDPATKRWWLVEATPDINEQLQYFRQLTGGQYNYLPDGIFITHAHIGHYTGLMQFGKEVMNTKEVKVYTLPKLRNFLEANGPWSQLVKLRNIILRPIDTNEIVALTDNIHVTAFTVPHRDEYSETAGFTITAGGKKYLFIPDINKWDKWNHYIIDEVRSVDVALLDATFYDGDELPGMRMSEVPHPFVTETMQLFDTTGDAVKAKIYFIHLNHTNPLLWNYSKQAAFKKTGYNLAQQGQKL